MNSRDVRLISIFCVSCLLVWSIGCPSGLPGATEDLTDAAADLPAGSPAECRVDVTTEGEGNVTVACSDNGRFATLSATPAEGFKFDRWIGSGSASNTITVTTGGNITITAVFISLTDDSGAQDLRPDGEQTDDNDNGNDSAFDDDGDDQDAVDDDDDAEDDEDVVQVTVIGGLGSDLYERGELVTVTAVWDPAEQSFARWVGDIEFIVEAVGNCSKPPVECSSVIVRAGANITLTATFTDATASTQPPTISISKPVSPTIQPNLVVFGREIITITIDAEILAPNPQEDRVAVFVDRDGLFNPTDPTQIRDEIYIANVFSSTSSIELNVGILERGVEYRVGAFINDGFSQTTTYALGSVRRSTLPEIYWVGSIDPPAGAPSQALAGMILEGVNVEDNAGSDFAGGEDLTGDGIDDFVVVSRYGKPQFINPDGVGIGEAYLIAGSSGRRVGTFNLNATSTSQLPGAVFTGIEQVNPVGTDTDGLSAVLFTPDTDGDGIGEIVFGIPLVDSAGWFAHPLDWLDLEGQLNRGGVVIVSSKTSGFTALTTGTRIRLDQVGQRFLQDLIWGANFPVPEPENNPLPHGDFGQDPCASTGGIYSIEFPVPQQHGWYVDAQTYEQGDPGDPDDPEDFGTCNGCVGSRFDPQGDGDFPDTWIEPSFGFAAALAPPFPVSFIEVFSSACLPPSPCPANSTDAENDLGIPLGPATLACPNVELASNGCSWLFGTSYCDCGQSATCPFSDCPTAENICCFGDSLEYTIGSGFYPDRIYDPSDTQVSAATALYNRPIDPLGARVIGRKANDRFGSSISIVQGNDPGEFFLLVGAPSRTGTIDETTALGTLDDSSLDPFCSDGSSCPFGIPGACGPGNVCGVVDDSGVAYMFGHLPYWENSTVGHFPPKPHQYIVNENSYCGKPNPNFITTEDGDIGRPDRRGEWFDANNQLVRETPTAALTIVGGRDQKIEIIAGIPDINGDTIPDIAVGAPLAASGDGAVYLVYRRNDELEGDYVLQKITFATNDPERLDGAYIRGDTASDFGSTIAAELDFNHDGISDLVVGAPALTGNGAGDVLIIFGGTDVNTPGNGLTVQQLLDNGQAVKIAGALNGGAFGFNVANAGDVDGDGRDDLLIAAPNATPHFDGNPFNTTDDLYGAVEGVQGVDLNHDGNADNITSANGLPDGTVDAHDQLVNAGLVYLILGRNNLGNLQNSTINIGKLGTDQLEGAIFVGRYGDRVTISGTIKGDYLGGGDAGDTGQGGIVQKANRFGRSRGLAGIGDIDNDGKDDFIMGSILSDVRLDQTGSGIKNAGAAYIIYGFDP